MNTSKEDQQLIITTAADAHLKAAMALNRKVRNARSYGLSWAEIGEALGVSKQAAQQRFGRTTGDDPASRIVVFSDTDK